MPTNSKKGNRYTKEFKDSILKRLNQPSNETVAFISQETNIPKATIYQWIKNNNQNLKSNPINLKSKTNWTSEDKFHVVLETATLSESELAKYCRRKGIYVEELKEWKEQCLSANATRGVDPNKLKDSLKEEQKRSKELQKQLRRKEKALADEGKYIASESTFYRVLKEEKMNTHRARSKPATKRQPPTHVATAPNEVWTWDITWLNAAIKGGYYKLYLILDMFSRLIVGYEVWEEETAQHAEHLHSGIKFITPYQRHYSLDEEIMDKRTQTYELARARHPERWTGSIRDWSLPDYVCLNPMSETEVENFINTKNDGSNKISLKLV